MGDAGRLELTGLLCPVRQELFHWGNCVSHQEKSGVLHLFRDSADFCGHGNVHFSHVASIGHGDWGEGESSFWLVS